MSAFPPPTRRAHRSPSAPTPRGSTLLVTIVLIAVLAVAGMALVARSRMGVDSAGAARRQEAVLSCADSARELLLSQFRLFGTSPTDLQLDRTTGGHRLGTGHFDSFNVKSTELVGGGAFEALPEGIGNRLVRGSGGGTQAYRFTVVCSDSNNTDQQAEVEYLVRFGL